jgi:glycosyltransferase involved in cell wall biosynthesis
MIVSLVTTFSRPDALARSLPQIAALRAPVLVVDDGGSCEEQNRNVCAKHGAAYLRLPENRGLAAALNIGLSFWLADSSVKWISYFQDDVDVHPDAHKALTRLHDSRPLLTGHDGSEHATGYVEEVNGLIVKHKSYIRATHMHGSAELWRSFLPVPTNALGTPKKINAGRGMGSNVDWWIVRDAPNSMEKRSQDILCVPGLVRSFLWRGSDSCWGNTSKAGEEPPLAAPWGR